MINGKKSLFYTVLMAGALMSCGGPKQAPSEEVAKSGNPVFEGWSNSPNPWKRSNRRRFASHINHS